MPCRDDRDHVQTVRDTELENALLETVDELTQNLCYICGNIEYRGEINFYANKRILKWWEQHKAADEKRVVKEMKSYIKKYYKKSKFPSVDKLSNYFIMGAKDIHPVSDYHEFEWFPEMATKVINELKEAYKKSGEAAVLKRVALSKLTNEEKAILGL